MLLPYHHLRRCTHCRKTLPEDLLNTLTTTNQGDTQARDTGAGGAGPCTCTNAGPNNPGGGDPGGGDPGGDDPRYPLGPYDPTNPDGPPDPNSPGDPGGGDPGGGDPGGGDPGEAGCPAGEGSGCPCGEGQLWEPPQPGGSPPQLHAATWRCTNGPGHGVLASNEVDRLTCDGQIQRVMLSAASVPLDIGRTTRIIPPALRTALEIRDGGCIIPDCHRPPGWCEAHHIQHWAHGGETSLQNLALLCSRHHHELHHNKWHITITDDGTTQTRRRPGRIPRRQRRTQPAQE